MMFDYILNSKVQLLMQIVIRMKHVRMPGVLRKTCLSSLVLRSMPSSHMCCMQPAARLAGRQADQPALGRAQDLAHHPTVPACWAPWAVWACPRLPAQQRAAG